MSYEFLWQNLVWLAIGAASVRAWRLVRTRLRRRRLRIVFGDEAVTRVAVTLPVLDPLTADTSAPPEVEKTVALKTSRRGLSVRLPVYGRLMHLDDYSAADQILALLRGEGAERAELLSDAAALGDWSNNACIVCLGSPFVNATTSELLQLMRDSDQELVSAERASDAIETYRLRISRPEALTLGVDATRGLGLIARLPNPATPRGGVVAVWGCRAETTLATARYLRREFRALAKHVERQKPFLEVLAVRGEGLDVAEPMLIATDRVVARRDDLLRWYVRDDDRPADASA